MFIKAYSYAFFYSTSVEGTHWSYSFRYAILDRLDVLSYGVFNCLAKIYLTLVPFRRYFLLGLCSFGLAVLILSNLNELSCFELTLTVYDFSDSWYIFSFRYCSPRGMKFYSFYTFFYMSDNYGLEHFGDVWGFIFLGTVLLCCKKWTKLLVLFRSSCFQLRLVEAAFLWRVSLGLKAGKCCD